MKPHLFFYQCKRCRTVAVAPIKYPRRELCCIQCHSYMTLMWSYEVVTAEQRRLYDQGPTWNPGTAQERDVHDRH